MILDSHECTHGAGQGFLHTWQIMLRRDLREKIIGVWTLVPDRRVHCTSPPCSACLFQGSPLESNIEAIHETTNQPTNQPPLYDGAVCADFEQPQHAHVRLDLHSILGALSPSNPPYANADDMLRLVLQRRKTHPHRVLPHKSSTVQ